MATKKQGTVKQPSPDDVVRFLAIMKRDDRNRLKAFCARIGANMESLATMWILDRLAVEEKKLSR